jgi:hypothetical protein
MKINYQPKEVVMVFTGNPDSHFFKYGGTLAWTLNPVRARECVYALCTRNAHDERWVPGPQKHRSPFLIGRIKAVVPLPPSRATRKGAPADSPEKVRFRIEFSEFARLDESFDKAFWEEGQRNPVRYYDTLESLGIDPSKLHFEPMPPRAQDGAANESLPALPDHDEVDPKYLRSAPSLPAPSSDQVGALTIAEAKRGLALGLGVSPDAVEITIRA